MDEDLIKLVTNKLQDTFSNLGVRPHLVHHITVYSCSTLAPSARCIAFAGGELDMPQLVVVCRLRA
jgi:hypothetical protein